MENIALGGDPFVSFGVSSFIDMIQYC